MDVTSRAQIDAETILERHWTDRLPVDSVAVAITMGIDSYWMTIGSDCSALTVKRNNERRIIGINQYESRSRQRFACAHAIGHHMEQRRRHLASHDDACDYVFRCHQSDFDDWNSPDELYANAFAASLLMPRDDIEELCRDPHLDIADIATIFDVTMAMVQRRTDTLGLHVTATWGMHEREPYFDDVW